MLGTIKQNTSVIKAAQSPSMAEKPSRVSNIVFLLSYNIHINIGDRNHIIMEKNTAHTIMKRIPVSALKNSFTKKMLNLIDKKIIKIEIRMFILIPPYVDINFPELYHSKEGK